MSANRHRWPWPQRTQSADRIWDLLGEMNAEMERHRALVTDLALVRDSELDRDEWERTRRDLAAELLARHGFGASS